MIISHLHYSLIGQILITLLGSRYYVLGVPLTGSLKRKPYSRGASGSRFASVKPVLPMVAFKLAFTCSRCSLAISLACSRGLSDDKSGLPASAGGVYTLKLAEISRANAMPWPSVSSASAPVQAGRSLPSSGGGTSLTTTSKLWTLPTHSTTNE